MYSNRATFTSVHRSSNELPVVVCSNEDINLYGARVFSTGVVNKAKSLEVFTFFHNTLIFPNTGMLVGL